MPHSHLQPVNPWHTEGNDYDPDQVYTRSVDGHGHQSHLRVNVPPNMAGEIHELVQKGLIPGYRTSQDFIRDAIYHRLHWANEQIKDGKLAHDLRLEGRRCVTDEINREIEELNGLVNSIRGAINQAVRAEDWYALGFTLESAEEQAQGIREPYRGRVFQMVRETRAQHAQKLYGGEE